MTNKEDRVPRFTLAGTMFVLLLVAIPFGSVLFVDLISINPILLFFDAMKLSNIKYLSGEYLIFYYNFIIFILIVWYFFILKNGNYSYFTKSISIILMVVFLVSALITQIVFSGMLYTSENRNVTPIENSR
ncbi:hypothetical protein PsW64_03351 [Pseudovibrio sp. W64]|uniref:hypothetical protein n=1 Tax=unclassified Pseudovibrio TaxID=2627060 RepID=UPI00071120F8|nr:MULTISPECIES: hypothetical protein [unclassified Pseudovibrio]KZK79007.1 hypothetical protein PsW64_03351 [Pseudovibrio sp. W64]